jgi:hypothetical protein
MHELGRFVQLNRKAVAVDVGCSSPSGTAEYGKQFAACDVVLCEFSSLQRLSEADICNFTTIVIDSRFPSGFFGSWTPTYGESLAPTGSVETPADLLDPSWWSRFSPTKSQARRLLIEVSAPSKCLHFLRDLPDRQLLEVLALRLSFLLGGSSLQLARFSQAKSIIAWARRKIRSSMQNGSKFERIRQFLATLLDTFFCEIHGAKSLNDVPSPTWEICVCEMPPAQRRAYNQICRESRAALSARDGSATRVAKFLFRLRRVCLHSDWQSLFTLSRGPSQPDRDLVVRILSHSGKFQRLLSILKQECDLNFHVDDFSSLVSLTGRTKSFSRTGQNSDRTTKRVAILASLPEARAGASRLLHCLGIMHDVVPRDVPKSSADSECESHALAWARSQLALSQFNDPMHENGRVHIVITSLEAVAGDTCGLGVELADLVISLDEDWSGRSELQMKSLVVRCDSRRQVSHCRFVKLVVASSCEQSFLAKATYEGNESNTPKEAISWGYQVAPFGSFSTSLSPPKRSCHADFNTSSFQRPDYFAFPTANVTALRNKTLSTVLSIDFSPKPLFASNDEMTFLPTDRVKKSVGAAENALTARLIECETFSPFRIDAYCSVGRRDLAVLASRLHLPHLCSDSITEHLNESVKLGVRSNGATIQDLPVNHATGVLEDDIEASQPGGAVVGLESLLFYGQDVSPLESAERINSYSLSLSATNRPGLVVDSSSGIEALVYFPPLFPRLLECHEAAQADIARRLVTHSAERQSSESLTPPAHKRPRLDSDSFSDLLGFNATDASTDLDVDKQSEEPTMKSGHVTEDEASHRDAASVLLDLREDYGVIGIGAIAIPQDSTLAAAAASVSTRHGAQVFDLLADGVTSVQEEAEQIIAKSLDSVVLFVTRKRPRGYAGYSHQVSSSIQRPSAGPAVWAMGVNSFSRSQDGVVSFADANGASKKVKKKLPAQGSGNSAFSRLSGAEVNPNHSRGPAILPSPKSRDIYRSRLLTSLKQTASGRTLFDAPPFRAASARVRRRIADRMCHQLWTSPSGFDSGSGLPLLSATANESIQSYAGSFRGTPMFWTSVVKRPRNSTATAGDESIEQANGRALAFHRSYVAPHRVDFGPFQAGFLSLLSGMTSAPPFRPRAGVCLPMGVKIPAQRDLPFPAWSSGQSSRLHTAVERYGLNWVLISGVLCGYHDIGSWLARNQVPRSPRDCRDHWQRASAADLNESSISVPADLVCDPGVRYDVNVQDSMKDLHLPSAVTFLNPTVASESGVDSTGNAPTASAAHSNTKALDPPRRFGRVMAAKSLRQSVTIAIPGLGSDGSLPQIVASHPSHMQAVQTSAASAWSSGRTEMWPLQLLDSAERYKNSLAAAGAPSASSSAAASAAATAPHQPATSSRSSSASIIPSQPNGAARLAPPTSVPAPTVSSPSYARLQPRLPSAGSMPPTAVAPSLAAAPHPHPASHTQPRPALASAQSFLPPSNPPPQIHPQHHQHHNHPQAAGSVASAAQATAASASHGAPPGSMVMPEDRARSESDPRSAGGRAGVEPPSPPLRLPPDSSTAP